MSRKILLYLGILIFTASAQIWAAGNEPAVNPQAQPEALSLDRCLELAFQNNKAIQANQKSITIAQEAVHQAQGNFQPTIGYDASLNNADPEATINSKTKESSRNYLSADLKASLPLYTGGKLEANLKLAQLKLNMAEEDLRKAKQTLTFNVKQYYYQVWLAEKQLEIQQAAYENMDQHFQRVQKFYELGKKSRYELYQAQVQRDTVRPKVISAENTLALGKSQLATAIGYPKNQSFTVDYDVSHLQLPASVTVTPDNLVGLASQKRPEIHQNHTTAEINQAQSQLDAAGNKPNVSLNATYKGTHDDDFDLGGWNRTWLLTLGVSGNFYDGNVTNSKVAQDKATRELTAIKEADLLDAIRLEAEQAIQNLSSSIETTRANQASIDLAKETLRMTTARYNEGMATSMDIMDSELALDNYLNQYYQGIVTHLTATAKLDLVAGKD